MLSPIGWANSITGSSVVIFGTMFGLFFIYKSRQNNAKLLFYTGFLTIFVSLFYLGQFVDFLAILITGRNLEPYQLYAILCYMWVAPALIFGHYQSTEIIIPEKQKIIILIYVVLGIIFEFFLWFDTDNSFVFRIPNNPGEDIIDVNFKRGSPTFILIAFFILSALILNGFGFLYRAIQSTGMIRKKFLYLSLGWIIFFLTAIFDALTSPGIILFLVRIGMTSSFWFWYFGLREEKLKPSNYINEKSNIPEGAKISFLERLSQLGNEKLTEEEVTFFREQTICLVCKGNASEFTYICPNCKALYCDKCARSLINLENACWICNSAIDHTKPVKIQDEEEVYDLKIANKKDSMK